MTLRDLPQGSGEEEEEEDPWDVRIAKTGCYAENERLQLCHAETGDWRKCMDHMKAFRECWERNHNNERVSTQDAPESKGKDWNRR